MNGLPPTGMIMRLVIMRKSIFLHKQTNSRRFQILTESMTIVSNVCEHVLHQVRTHIFILMEEGITFLYYPNWEWELQEGGETQFYIDGNILGVPPVPNRLVVFDGMIQHRATSFRNKHRFTIAIKYGYEETPE